MTKEEMKTIRKNAKFSQKEMAEYLGLSDFQRISEYERGIRKPSKSVIKLYYLLKK
jgi:transcriptional regulator with XRE-family HTH domain